MVSRSRLQGKPTVTPADFPAEMDGHPAGVITSAARLPHRALLIVEGGRTRFRGDIGSCPGMDRDDHEHTSLIFESHRPSRVRHESDGNDILILTNDLRPVGTFSYHDREVQKAAQATVTQTKRRTLHSMANRANSLERRSFPRTGLSLTVQLTVVSTLDPRVYDPGTVSGTTTDVSRGGCAVFTEIELRERTRCIARFPAAGGRLQPDTMWAEVRRSIPRSGGVLLGLEFETPLEALRISPAATSTTESDAPGPAHILIVDDQPGIRGLLARFLADRGFEVAVAADGEEAFRRILQRPPDVMLVDLYLPRLNGHDLLRRLQEVEIAIPLIYTMSGYADTQDAQECLRMGASDHLLKPLDLDHLHRSISLRLGALRA